MSTDMPSAPYAHGAPGGWLLPDNLLENLQLIADGAVAVAGFAVAAIRVRRGDELELVVDTELPDEVGSRIPLQLMLDELAVAEDWGLLRFVPHERGSTGPAGAGWVIPEIEMLDDPDAWHPMDMLVAPLYDEHGELRGTFAIDLPLDGRRPDAERRKVLERFAELAARAVLSALERESLAEQVAMANTVKSIVRTSSAQLSLDGLLRASETHPARRLRCPAPVDQGRRPTSTRVPSTSPQPCARCCPRRSSTSRTARRATAGTSRS